MSDELREIITNFFNEAYQETLQNIPIEYLIDRTIKQIQDERKKWTKGCVPKKRDESECHCGFDAGCGCIVTNFNECRAKTLENIKEG